MVPELVQENLFQYEAPEGVGRPIHQSCCQFRQQVHHSAGLLKSLDGFISQQTRQSPRREGLFKNQDSARDLVATKNQARDATRGRSANQLNRAQAIQSQWTDGIQHLQNRLFASRVVKSRSGLSAENTWAQAPRLQA
jgi:hypothetical protein